jgi:hypothetical protein
MSKSSSSTTACRCAAHSGRSCDKSYLHRGIAARGFKRHFDLADYVEVTDATMGESLLVIDLKRELPEALKPRSIPITPGHSRLWAARRPARPRRMTSSLPEASPRK